MMVLPVAGCLFPFLASDDPYHRGYAAWALRALSLADPPGAWQACLQDQGRLQFYAEGDLHDCSVAWLAGGDLNGGMAANRER
jgi:hypothetical protein